MNKLDFEIRRRGITQTALAEQTGLHRVVINELIHGKRKPYPKAINALVEALGWQGNPDELFEEVD